MMAGGTYWPGLPPDVLQMWGSCHVLGSMSSWELRAEGPCCARQQVGCGVERE